MTITLSRNSVVELETALKAALAEARVAEQEVAVAGRKLAVAHQDEMAIRNLLVRSFAPEGSDGTMASVQAGDFLTGRSPESPVSDDDVPF